MFFLENYDIDFTLGDLYINDFEIDEEQYRNIIQLLGNGSSNDHCNRSSLQEIHIYGLFGKYDYHFELQNDVAIWVSENGVGKTTILNLIVAVLNGDKKTILGIEFERIVLKINGRKFEIDKSDTNRHKMDELKVERLFELLGLMVPSEMVRRELLRYKRTGSIDVKRIDYLIHRYHYDEISYSYDLKRVYMMLDEILRSQYNDISDVLDEISNELTEECLFYPTYRRIEISQDKVFQGRNKGGTSELIQYIEFGMEDVEKRINGLLEKIRTDAIGAYADMSSTILNELSSKGNVFSETKQKKQIDYHKLEVVIKRIGEERLNNIDYISRFVNGETSGENDQFLKYYLYKLVDIYDRQKAIDDKLTKFAKVCSKYLVRKDVVYDEALLSLSVYNDEREKIGWNDLSSGEKQIVGIFSKVYLDITTSAIFIIDEPEISLSINWQKEFLKDIYDSGKIKMLIATTHSPFIFKNEFRGYTEEIVMHRSRD